MNLRLSYLVLALFLASCAPRQTLNRATIPALQYANQVRPYEPSGDLPAAAGNRNQFKSNIVTSQLAGTSGQAQLRYAKDWPNEDNTRSLPELTDPGLEQQLALNRTNPADSEVYRNNHSAPRRDYESPLSLGNPGTQASLWQENRRSNNLFRDRRAWQPYDLVTIVITEKTEGKKEADTDTSGESSAAAKISSLLGIESTIQQRNPQMNLDNLINATTSTEFKGEGETTRKGTLKGTISAMVVEVLPGDILRIAGEKIISVNEEEQIMIISGLIRPWDVDANNEIDSSKVAQLRIDYFGKGAIGDVQEGGWMFRIISKVWPF